MSAVWVGWTCASNGARFARDITGSQPTCSAYLAVRCLFQIPSTSTCLINFRVELPHLAWRADQMKSFKGRSLLIALASLLWISGCMADELTMVLKSAEATHDKRTGKPVVELTFPKAFSGPLLKWSHDNVGKMLELLVDGRVVYRAKLREPLYGGHLRFYDPDWTDEAANDLARQISKTPNGQVELRSSPQPN